jgi:hypothetical protein
MRALLSGLLMAGAVLLTGCATAPQAPVELSSQAIGKPGKIGVAMTKLPKVDTHLFGADCLLCLAVASAANSSLTTHANTLPYEDLPQVKHRLAELVRKKGGEAIVLPDALDLSALPNHEGKEPNSSRKNFSSLQAKHGIDRLLLIDVTTLGFARHYASYIPTSDPKATLRAVGYLVNLETNTYEWYREVHVTRSADKAWDEPPKFPGLTNAYFQAIEIGKDELTGPFAR